jgi:secondary thiamine-phosphate synthase enzyme
MWWQSELIIQTERRGLYLITDEVLNVINSRLPEKGLVHLFIKHTSASLLLQENADPSARHDLESYMEKLAPESQEWHTHTTEGPDDIAAHLRSAVTPTSLTIPIIQRRLGLGTWQGIYLWEHRRSPHRRKILLTLQGEG